VEAWADAILPSLPSRARARFKVGRWMPKVGDKAVFALPNDIHRSYCEEVRSEVETAIAEHFGTRVPLELVVDPEAAVEGTQGRGAGTEEAAGRARREPDVKGEDPELLDREVLERETTPAGSAPTAADMLKQAFPGAEEI
jgi:hypothetical protein